MTSNEAVGPTDIKNLLDLLNASEEDAAPGNDSKTVLPWSETEPGGEDRAAKSFVCHKSAS
jgi:hypothetical protein